MDHLLGDNAVAGLLLNGVYDVLKFTLGYMVAQGLYGYYKSFRYGGYRLQVLEESAPGEVRVLTERKMTAAWAEKILTDENELSVYVKGVVSPFGHLKMDVGSQEAVDKGLMKMDKARKMIQVDLSCPGAVLRKDGGVG